MQNRASVTAPGSAAARCLGGMLMVRGRISLVAPVAVSSFSLVCASHLRGRVLRPRYRARFCPGFDRELPDPVDPEFQLLGQHLQHYGAEPYQWRSVDRVLDVRKYNIRLRDVRHDALWQSLAPGGVTSVQFISGSSELRGLTSGNYRPNPAAFNGLAQPPAYNNNSTTQAAIGGTIHMTLGNAALFDLSNVGVGMSTASPMSVTNNQFPVNAAGNPLVTGFDSLTLAMQALNVFVVGPIFPSVDNSLTGLAQPDASTASANIAYDPYGDLTMTIPVVVPFSLPIGDGAYFNGTAAGKFVAFSDPEPSTLLLALMGLGGIVAFQAPTAGAALTDGASARPKVLA